MEPGKTDYNIKDDKGQKVSQHSAVHMSKHRIRCYKCMKNFCALCKRQPYHVGQTC